MPNLSVRKIPLNAGGYDRSGRYYGGGPPLYELEAQLVFVDPQQGPGEEWVTERFRARNRADAVRIAKAFVTKAEYWLSNGYSYGYARSIFEKGRDPTYTKRHFDKETKINEGRHHHGIMSASQYRREVRKHVPAWVIDRLAQRPPGQIKKYADLRKKGRGRDPTTKTRISPNQLPKTALRAIPARQRSYIDEFVFRRTSQGIEA